MAKPKIVVIGSANMDLVVRTEHVPTPGETVIGDSLATMSGGKGANQAVAAARLGGNVWFVGRVGMDEFGDRIRAELESDGIHLNHLERDSEHSTGVALISVGADGQNSIVVAPGANHALSAADLDRAEPTIAAADILLLQLEIPMATVAHAIRIATRHNVAVALNPAPLRDRDDLPDALLQHVGVVTPNEHEAAAMLGARTSDEPDWEFAARQILAMGPASVVITLGDKGCAIAADGLVRRIAAFPIIAIDSTAAGDCFAGALAVALAEGRSLEEAATFASRAASISVTRRGAQPSLPNRREVDSA